LNPIKDFTGWVEYLSQDHASSFETVSRLLAVRACIDFFLMKNRGSPSGWDKTKALYSSAQQHAEAENNARLADHMKELKEKLPFREKQWLKAAESWRALCDGPLSDEALDQYLARPPNSSHP